jgi:hypothetical protein
MRRWYFFLIAVFFVITSFPKAQTQTLDLMCDSINVYPYPPAPSDTIVIEATIFHGVTSLFPGDTLIYEVDFFWDSLLVCSTYCGWQWAALAETCSTAVSACTSMCSVWLVNTEGESLLVEGLHCKPNDLNTRCCCWWPDKAVGKAEKPKVDRDSFTITVKIDPDNRIPEFDETNNECTKTFPTPGVIPTLTEWGLIIFGVVLLGFISYVFLRRKRPVVSVQ